MEPVRYFESLSMEMTGLRDRVRQFIGDSHWLTDGEWKESVLRHFLRRSLPRTFEVGRGFIVSAHGISRQIDILIYDAAKPVLFRDGDLVLVTPDAAVGIIEVKTRLDSSNYAKCLESVSANLDFLGGQSRYRRFYGIFAYESELSSAAALEGLQSVAKERDNRAVELLCLGEDHFIRYWYLDPIVRNRPTKRWHSYQFSKLAFGYFIHNCVEYTDPQSVSDNSAVWYPFEEKELYKDADIGMEGPVVEYPLARASAPVAHPDQ